jgi:hypothetical protein
VDATSLSLLAAHNKAEALFNEVVSSGMIRAEKLESELTTETHELARKRFGSRLSGAAADRRRIAGGIGFVQRFVQ